MARIAGVVVPGIPLHITQRGNRRQKTFFRDEDYLLYVDLMRYWCSRTRVQSIYEKIGAAIYSKGDSLPFRWTKCTY
jgi:REP element-mobilizing transposase RayT